MHPAAIDQDPEAAALAACYRLLLQKAAERQARQQEADSAATSPTQDAGEDGSKQ